MYTDTLQNSTGCDSLVTVDLTINTNQVNTINDTACDTYYSPSGAMYDSTGVYYDTIPTAAGCDSLITINLTVNQSTSSTMSDSVVDSYTWPVNGQTYTSTGTYYDTLTNAAGCDSVVTLVLFVQHTGIGEHFLSQVTLYPNPANDFVVVEIPEEIIDNNYEVIDLHGKTLLSGTLTSDKTTIQINELAAGIYLLKIDGLESSIRILKE